jgi:hypothetical protein
LSASELDYVAIALPAHPAWPHWQASCVISFAASQAALQYFSPSGTVQLHAECAHVFTSLAISFSPAPLRPLITEMQPAVLETVIARVNVAVIFNGDGASKLKIR